MRHLVLGLIAVGAVAAGAFVIDIQTGRVSALIDEFKKGGIIPQMVGGGGEQARLASKGDAKSLFLLGQMYYQGKGADKNYERSADAFLGAAKQGHRRAQYNLGVMYFRGLGVEKNTGEAYMWFSVAASRGYAKAAKAMRRLEGKLSATQIIEARNKAEKFRNQN